MSHAGSSPCPDNSCPDNSVREQAAKSGSTHDAPVKEPIGFRHHGPVRPSAPAWSLPMQAARADAESAHDSLPFVVQAGQRLVIVAEESSGWVVAELRFNLADCIFVETRRAHFQWPREAFGRLLSLTLIGAEADQDAVQRVTESFGKWLALQFATPGRAA